MSKKDSKDLNAGAIGRLDVFIIVALFLLTFLIRVPFFDYPIIQDSAVYAELSESIHNNFSYEFEGEPSKIYPPGQPFLASLILFFHDDASLATRLVSIFFGSLAISLCYIFLRFLDVRRNISLLLCGVVFFNPWFFYFTTILGLSEGAGTFFLLLGLFFMFLYATKRMKTGGLVLGALFLGLSVMVRVVFVVVVSVFCFYFLWLFLHKKSVKDAVLFMTISSFPFVVWFLRNLFVNASGGYSSYIYNSIISYPYGLLYFTVLVFPLAFLGSIWYIIKSFNVVFRATGKYWKLVLVSFVLTMLVSILGWDLVNHLKIIQNPWNLSTLHIDVVNLLTNPFFATRYFVPFIPILTILAGWLFFNAKVITKNKRVILVVYVAILLFSTVIYNSGYLQNRIATVLPVPQTSTQKLDAALQVVYVLKESQAGAPYVDVRVSDYVLNSSITDLLNRLCAGCRLSGEKDAVAGTHLIVKDISCSGGQEAIAAGCKSASCIFESVGKFKASIFRCNS